MQSRPFRKLMPPQSKPRRRERLRRRRESIRTSRSERTQPPAKATFDQFISRIKIAAEIVRQQNKTDDYSADHVSEDHLQECEVRIISETGNADDGERAGFCGDDGKSNRPPGNIAIGKKVVAKRTLAFAKSQAKQGDAGKIDRDNGEIGGIQAHGSLPQSTRFGENKIRGVSRSLIG